MSGSINQGIGAVTSGQSYGTGALTASRTYTLTVTNAAGQQTTQQVTVTVVAAASITSFYPSKSTITSGTSTNLNWAVSNSTSQSISPTVGGVGASGATGVSPTTSTTYTLTAYNAAGDYWQATTTVNVVAAVVISSFTANTYNLTVGNSTTLNWNVSNATLVRIGYTGVGSTEIGNNLAASGSIGVTPGSSLTYYLTGYNAANDYWSANLTVNVYAAPTAGISASTTNPLYGATNVTVTPSAGGGASALIVGTSQGASNISANASSGVALAVQAGGFTSATTYWARASNPAGSVADASVRITPQTVAVSAISGGGGYLSVGRTRSLMTTISGAVNQNTNWTANGGSFSPTTTANGAWTTYTAPASTGSYTITATSAADGSKAATTAINVVALPVATSITLSTSSPLYGAAVTLTPSFSNGTGSINQGIGAVSSGVGVSSGVMTSAKTFTLTVTNLAGDTATVATTVTPQIVSVSALSPASPTKSVSTQTTFSASVSGAANSAINWSCSGGSITSGGVWTAPATPGSYTITATSAADGTKSNSTTVTVVALPSISSFTLTEASGTANDAKITLGDSITLNPTFAGGTGSYNQGLGVATSGVAKNDTPASLGLITYTLTVTNAAGDSTSASATVTVYAVPTASLVMTESSGTANDGLITAGDSVTLTPTFANGTATLGTTGSGSSDVSASCTTGVGVVNTPGGSKTYTLTVTNPAGRVVTATANVISYAAPSITSFSNNGPINRGATAQLSFVFANGTGTVNNGIGAVTSGTPITTPALTTGTTYTLTVTNPAGTSAQSTTTVSVNAVSVGVTPSTATKSVNATQQFTATVTGAVDNSVTWSCSGGTVNASGLWTAPATPGSYTVTATSNSDNTKTSSASVTVVALPTASLSPAANPINYGATTNITPTFTGGTGSVNQGIGAVTSGTPFNSGTLTAAKSFTLTVTNAAGDTATATSTINVNAVTVSAITSTNATCTVGTSETFSATVTGAVNTAITWSATGPGGGGSWAGSTWTAPMTPGTYTIKATAQADGTTFQTFTETVVAAATASLTCSDTNPLVGATNVTLTPTFTNGTAKVGTTAGGSDIANGPSSGQTITLAAIPLTARTYTLRVTNAAGDYVDSQVTVTPKIVAVGAPYNDGVHDFYITTGRTKAWYATVTNAVNTSVNWSTTGNYGSWSGNNWTAPVAAGSYTLVATSVADPSKSNSITLQAIAAPSMNIAGPTSIPHGASATLIPTWSSTGGASATFAGTDGFYNGDINSGDSFTMTPEVTTTYTLTVVNAAGDSFSTQLVLTVEHPSAGKKSALATS